MRRWRSPAAAAPATFRRVIVPLSARGIAAGAILSFAHTMGEFGVVLMVGGDLPAVVRFAAKEVHSQPGDEPPPAGATLFSNDNSIRPAISWRGEAVPIPDCSK